ncbi:amino acid adenylation domain-containing protein [Bacillus mycoides]|uniref:amino acid adenylation domain-containing protein n=1 Tax=Bacillus mycoides TaxID=1405 RepID=UPI003CFC78F0
MKNILSEQVIEKQGSPLSFSQEGLWILDNIDYDSNAYNNSYSLKMVGSIDISHLTKSINKIQERHEVLRSRFSHHDKGMPKVFIEDFKETDLPVIDISQLKNKDNILEELLKEEAKSILKLNEGRLVRYKYIKYSKEVSYLILTVHHIIWDEWSIKIFSSELSNFYGRLCQGKDLNVPSLPKQYHDFVKQEREYAQKDEYKEKLAYWTNSLQDTPKTFKFIGDKNLSKGTVCVEDNKDIVKKFNIPAEISRNLKLISKKNKSTLFMTLFSLFSAVLKRYTSQNEFVIGAPIANRSSYDFENLIGFFTNTLPINVDFLSSGTFREFLKNNRSSLLKAYANHEVSVEKIVETLQVEREKTKAPLVQVSFVYHSLSEKRDSSNDLVFDITEIDSGISKFDLTMAISELENDLVGEIRCKSTILSMGIVNKMIDDVLRIAALISIDDDILLHNLVFDDGEYDKVIYHFNETDSPYETNKCIHEFIEEQAELIPNQIALVELDKQITYFELNEKANKLANYLLRKGIKKRSLVAITTSASIESLISILAVLKTGGAYVPLDIHSPSTRLEYILADCKAPFLLVDKENENEFSFFNGQRILIDYGNEEIAKENVQNPQIEVFQNDLAYVIYTSGSTGKPKGVMVDHRAIVILGEGLNKEIIKQHIHVERPIRLTLNASLAFDASIQQIQSLCYGNEIYLISEKIKYDPEKFVNYIKEHEIDILDCTPSQLNMLIKAGILNAKKTKYPLITLIGGETIDQNMWALLKTCKEKHFYNVYGLTECGVDSTFEYINESLIESNIGNPLPNKKIYILDKNMKPVRIGVPGDIYIGGGGLARGYLNRSELTAKTFIPDPFAHIPGSRMYKTGDLGLYTEEGKIKFLGRSDNQVQLKGYRVELSEIEAAINEIPNVKKSFVCIRQDEEPILVGYIEVTPEKNISIREIRGFMESRMPYYMIPVQFFRVKKWPLTSNGKLDRTKLMSLNDKFVLEEDDVDITPIQQILINLWKEVLKIDEIGIRDNFFELGGHSLLGTQIISKINKTFNLSLSLHSFFRYPTIHGVSEEIARSRNKNQDFRYSLIERVENKPDKLPLSSAQQRLWFMNTLVPNKYIFNIPIFYELKGKVDILSLEKAIQFVINRHEVLRTNFYAVKGELLQVLRNSAPFKLRVNKIDKYTLIENELESFMDKEAKHAFSLTNDLLIRGSIIQINDSRSVLALTFHHIIFDGWSLNVFMKELSCFYNSLVAGENIELNELPIQYSDYTIWQNKELSKEVWVKQLSYWKRKLGGTLPVMQLPVDNARPKVPSYKGSEEQLIFSKDILEKLKSFCVAQGTTLHMTLLSIFNVMLYKYTNQKDIMVGNFVAGRNKEEIESLIGFFINTLVIRTDLSNNPSFIQLVEQVRENTLDAYENQDIPFDMVVQEVKPDRTLDASPLVRVMFVVQNIPKEDLRFNGFEITQRRRPDDIVKYDLTVKYSEDGGKVVFEYSTDLFSRQTIISMINYFQILIETFLENPDKRVDDLAPIQNSKYLNDDKVTKAISDNSRIINEIFGELVEELPLKTALVYKDSYLTYEELNNKSNQLAHYLIKQGVTSNVPVAICVNRGLEYLIGILGVLKAGGAYVPLDPGYPRERLDFIIEDSQAQLVLTTSDIASTFTQDNVLLCMLDQQLDFTIHSSTNLEWKPKLDDLAYIIYTSGSTGRPKGVMVTHRNLLNLISWHQSEYQLSHEDRGTLIAGLGFDAAVWEIFPCLCSGATLYILEEEIRSNPVELQQWMTDHGITIGYVPTPLVEPLLELDWSSNHTLKAMFTGGERLVISKGYNIPFRLIDLYGPTENTVVTTFEEVDVTGKRSESSSIGKPIANVQTYILDENLKPVPIGVVGELCISGSSLAVGYKGRPELTAEKFVANPFSKQNGDRLYKTGDMARYLPDGSIDFIGRKDNQVKIRGYRIELGEIEYALKQHSNVKAALLLKSEDKDSKLIAYVIVNDKNDFFESGLKEYLQLKLPSFMIPFKIFALEKFPLNTNGKIDRNALLNKLFHNSLVESTKIELNTNFKTKSILNQKAIEEEMVDIWKKEIGLDSVQLDDHFFKIGGHSLLLTKIMGAIQDRFNVQVSLRALFEAPTVRGMADQVREALNQKVPLTIEEEMVDIWKKEIGLDSVQLDDHFFKIGGHSLLLTKIMGAIQDRFNVQVSLRALFETPTVRGMAKQVQESKNDSLDEIEPETINRHQIPLSFNQQRLWFMDRLTTEKAAYNVPMLFNLDGVLDVQALNHSINKVIERHEILRTYFKDGEKVVQVVKKELRIETPVVNLMDLSDEDRQHRIMTMKREEVHKPFDLEVGPLIRSLIIQETPNKYLFILNIHHILADGWSLKILMDEIASFYISYVNKTEPTLPALSIQYGDYAVWQRAWLEGHYLDKQLSYWKEKLKNSMSTLSLRTDYIRPKKLKHIGGKESIELSSKIVEAVRNLSHDKNVTSYMTFMSAFKVLLYCYTKQEDLSIGTLIGNRTKSEIEHLIGFFVNTLVIRTKISESQKFEDLLDDVRTTVLEAYANQEVPFDKIVEEVQPKRTLGYSPLFQVLYTYESNLKSNLKFGDVSVNPHPFDSDYTKFDLTLAVEDLKDKVKITMEYNSSLFNKETIIRMLDDLRIIIKEIVAASKVSLKRLSTILDIQSKYQETYPNKGENKQMISTKKQFKDPNMNEEKDLIPSNMLEVKMKAIWQEILEVEEVKGTDNFFELGGHSLNALQMISKLKKMYKVNIPVSYIFDNPSLTQFTSAVLLAILSDIECSTGEEL